MFLGNMGLNSDLGGPWAGLALVASMLAGSLNFALFDEFAFPQACGTLFMVAGLCGAYANIQRTADKSLTSGLP